ncbi:hypothetical protein [Sphingomonas morindae]|uniref:RHS repeat protein n=1 Tax=Sphingomonas morindae TaxID=1541170 RepID=A0ABY4XBA0_9SPHN|nr:hypothetical protein [Sphingomonas morindae]USI73970.1 hypothetical protein LHA26_05760 [Sphingomonas morindae]
MPAASMPSLASLDLYTIYQPDDGTYLLYGQRLDAQGNAIGAPILVSDPGYTDNDGNVGQVTILKDGGFVVSYDSRDPFSPFDVVTTVVRHYDSNGATGGQLGILGPYTFYDNVIQQRQLLDNGGFAILATDIRSDIAPDVSISDSTLIIGTPHGGIVQTEVAYFETDGGTPLPSLLQSQPVLSVGPDDSVIVRFDRAYSPPNPDFPTDDPTGTQHFEFVYDAEGRLESQRFADFDGTVTTTRYDASGHDLETLVRHPDGSISDDLYGITGQAYVHQVSSYDASGHLVSMQRYAANGTLILDQSADRTESYAPDGSHILYRSDGAQSIIDSYDAAGTLISEDVRNSVTGSHVRDLYQPGHGYVFEEQSFFADGSRTIDDYDGAGNEKTVTYDATGFVTGQVRRAASGAVFTETHDHQGGFTVDQSDAFGRPIVSIVGDTQGKTVITTQWDGLNDTPPRRMIEHWSGDMVTDREFITPESDRVTIYAAGVTKAINPDTLVVGSPLGAGTFVFGETLGKVTIAGFLAGDAPNHDVLDLRAAGITSPEALQGHIAAAGGDTLITLSPHDTILLRGISEAALTSADFFFH